MPFSVGLISLGNSVDPDGVLQTSPTITDFNNGTANAGDTYSGSLSSAVTLTIDENEIVDGGFDNSVGSTLSEDTVIDGVTYAAGSVVESDYTAFLISADTGYYYTLSIITIDGVPVGGVMSLPFDPGADAVVSDGSYADGETLTLADPDGLMPGSTAFDAFVQDTNYSSSQGYTNDFDLTPTAVGYQDPSLIPDGIVEGTGGDDTIDAGYSGDPEGDMVDAGDGTNGTSGDQDVITAGAGDDVVMAGEANDTIYGDDGPGVITDVGAGLIDTNLLYTVTSAGELRTYDSETDTETVIQTGLQVYGDIAILPGGELVGVVWSGTADTIFQIDPDTGAETAIATISPGYHAALTANSQGDIFYNTGDNFAYIPSNGDGTYGAEIALGTLPAQTKDLVFLDDQTLYAVANGSIFRLELNPDNTIATSTDLGQVVPGQTDIWGISIENGQLVAFEGSGEAYATDIDADPLNWTLQNGTTAGSGFVYGAAGSGDVVGGVEVIGNDTLHGEAGDDVVYAGHGDDVIYGGVGDDDMFGEAGDDIFALEDGFGDDEIVGGETGETGGDTLDASAVTANLGVAFTGDEAGSLTDGTDAAQFSEIEAIITGSGDDEVDATANAADLSITTGAGSDNVALGDGAQVVDTGDDADTISFGGAGQAIGDTVDGGTGGDDNDTLDLTGTASAGGSLVVNATAATDGTGFDGTVQYFDEFGTLEGTLTFTDIETVVPCFTPGTKIKVLGGERPVEDLRVGHKVLTRDNGFQTIRWIGQRALGCDELLRNPEYYPIEIAAGALGNGLPERAMRVSPQHRMLIEGPGAQMYFGTEEVLVAAAHLTCLPGVRRVEPDELVYIHLLFDRHEIVLADGAWSESFQPGDMSMAGLDDDARMEILGLFPELAEIGAAARAFPAARQTVRGREAPLLFA